MTEKDTVSMTTVQMKPDYAASEVYSTTSEAPPAYKRQSNSVKIAKIAAFTIVASSFILGSFILASSYLQAKASCDQVQALDSVLEKELMLETLQQVSKELPRAEALLGKENVDDNDLQNLDKEEPVKQSVEKPLETTLISDNNNEIEDTEVVRKYPGKVPLELDLSDLAAALLQNNKKSRMNCVVERKHAEEIVDSPSKTVALPFGMNLTTDPKKARITGERISIYCEGGNENREQETRESAKSQREEDDDTDDDAEPIRTMFIPYQRMPIPFGQIPQQFPLTHMPQRMMPPIQQQPMIRQMPPPFQQLPLRPPMPPQVMQAPHPEPHMHQMMEQAPQQQTVRIHLQQLPFREIHVSDNVPMQMPTQQQELPHFQIQRMPLGMALQRVGITADDLRNIQRLAEDRISEELRRLAAEEAAESAETNSNSSEEEDDSQQTSSQQNSNEQDQSLQQQTQTQQQQEQRQEPTEARTEPQITPRLILQPLPEQPRDTMIPPMPDQPSPMMQYGRATFGRSLAQPVRIPVPMMQQDMSQDSSASASESERPHFVHPRSV